MSINTFGRELRKARKTLQETLSVMAENLGYSIAFLSAMETGRTRIPMERIEEIEAYLTKKGYRSEQSLRELAMVANENVPLYEGLSYQQKLLVAGFANSPLTSEQLKIFASFMEEIKNSNHKENSNYE